MLNIEPSVSMEDTYHDAPKQMARQGEHELSDLGRGEGRCKDAPRSEERRVGKEC